MILYLHGRNCWLPSKLDFLKQMSLKMKADVYSVAYRGFSMSDGKSTTKGIFYDLEAIVEFYRKEVQRKGGNEKVQTVLWGKSFGAAASLQVMLMTYDIFSSLVIESPFTTVKAVYRSLIPCMGHIFAWMSKIRWDNENLIDQITVPLMIISGKKDNTTPNWMACELFERATSAPKKKLYNIENAKHRSLHKFDDDFWPKVIAFFSETTAPTINSGQTDQEDGHRILLKYTK